MTKEQFKSIRLSAGMTQNQLAVYLGMSENSVHISRIENGHWRLKRTLAILMEQLDAQTRSGEGGK